jgi:hypothetical protein
MTATARRGEHRRPDEPSEIAEREKERAMAAMKCRPASLQWRGEALHEFICRRMPTMRPA